jgi:biotin operon repressor
MQIIKQKERYINLPYNDIVKSLDKSALIIYANLINMRNINKNKGDKFLVSNKYIKNTLSKYDFYISDTKIKENLKILRDCGLINYESNGIPKDGCYGEFATKLRKVTINNVKGTILNGVKLRTFVKSNTIQSIRMLMYLFYIVEEDIMMGSKSSDVSNENIADELNITNKKVKIYLDELKECGLINYESKDNNKIRTITIYN